MEKETLLAEIEEKKKEVVEKQFLEHKQDYVRQQFQKKDKTINIFSANAFPKEQTKNIEEMIDEKEDKQKDEVSSRDDNIANKDSLVIEKPNYDFIETLTEDQRKKIFKIERNNEESQQEVKPKKNRFKMIMLSILFAIFGVWGIVNITTLDSLSGQIAEVTTQYNMNLVSYLNNLHNLDATNAENMENLFETIPVESQKPNTIEEQSNWFDRFCNFIAGLFGG